MSGSIENRLVRRFMRYSAIETQSNAANANKCIPSSPGQQKLAELIAEELRSAGLSDVVCDSHATVTAIKRGNAPNCHLRPRVGFICHLDTFDAGLNPHVHAQKIHYTGGDVCLNAKESIIMKVSEHPELTKYVNQDILFSDGTSVLGADDKAAVSSVMEMITTLGKSNCTFDDTNKAENAQEEVYGDIIVCFVPDEEIGLIGAKHLDLARRFHVDFAYTLDCCELGEVVLECFNAASATITFMGVAAHPMSAKGVMVNPIMMAVDYMNEFDRRQTPEMTEMREGYWWFASMQANASEATLGVMIREHDQQKFEERKQYILTVAQKIAAKFPTGQVKVQMEDVYANLSKSLTSDRTAIEILFEACAKAQVQPNVIPMRGGTDGAALSAKGLFTPNYFTGAHNFHSRYEFLPIPSFVKAYEVTRQIVLIAAQRTIQRKADTSHVETSSNL